MINGTLTLGDFTAFYTYLVMLIGPMRMQYAHVAAQTAYVADRVGEMLTRIMREE